MPRDFFYQRFRFPRTISAGSHWNLVYPFRFIPALRHSAITKTALLVVLLILTAAIYREGDYLFHGTAHPGIESRLDVVCAADAPACAVVLQDLGEGRWRLMVRAHDGAPIRVKITSYTEAPRPPAGILLLRAGYDRFSQERVKSVAAALNNTSLTLPPVDGYRPGNRLLVALPPSPDGSVHIELRQGGNDSSKPLILDEIGLYSSSSDINRIEGYGVIGPNDLGPSLDIARRLLTITLVTLFLASLTTGRFSVSLTAFAAALSFVQANFIVLLLVCGPEWSSDIRLLVASGTLLEPPGVNLNYGMYMAHGLLNGHGPTINGIAPWSRMPGYAFILALAGPGADLFTIGVRSLAIHILLIAASVAALVFALSRLAFLPPAALVAAMVAVAPKTPWYTQIESVMLAPACFLVAAGCYVIAETERAGRNILKADMVLHAAFAFWFFIRTDIVPAWALVSLLLYLPKKRDWWRLSVPVSFFLAIGLPWALFKLPFTGEFNMTTTSFGASFMIGLWEIPHPFVWTVSDGAYYDWAGANGWANRTVTAGASSWAVKECIYFILAYPMNLVALVANKLMVFLSLENAGGVPVLETWNSSTTISFITLGNLIAIALLWHRPKRLLLLSAVLLFNTPLFFIVFSSVGRFYNTTVPAMFALPVVYLCDASFWRSVRRHPARVTSAVVLTLLVARYGNDIAKAMLSDEFRFSFSIVDPAKSTLVRFARPLDLSGSPYILFPSK